MHSQPANKTVLDAQGQGTRMVMFPPGPMEEHTAEVAGILDDNLPKRYSLPSSSCYDMGRLEEENEYWLCCFIYVRETDGKPCYPWNWGHDCENTVMAVSFLNVTSIMCAYKFYHPLPHQEADCMKKRCFLDKKTAPQALPCPSPLSGTFDSVSRIPISLVTGLPSRCHSISSVPHGQSDPLASSV